WCAGNITCRQGTGLNTQLRQMLCAEKRINRKMPSIINLPMLTAAHSPLLLKHIKYGLILSHPSRHIRRNLTPPQLRPVNSKTSGVLRRITTAKANTTKTVHWSTGLDQIIEETLKLRSGTFVDGDPLAVGKCNNLALVCTYGLGASRNIKTTAVTATTSGD